GRDRQAAARGDTLAASAAETSFHPGRNRRQTPHAARIGTRFASLGHTAGRSCPDPDRRREPMRPTEQPSPPSTRPEPRPEPAGPGSKSCDVAAPQAEGGREPASQWEGYDLLVLD